VPNDPNTPGSPEDPDLHPDFLFSFSPPDAQAARSPPEARPFNMHARSFRSIAGGRRSTGRSSTARPETGATCTRWWKNPDAGRHRRPGSGRHRARRARVDVFGKITGAAERVLERSLPKLGKRQRGPSRAGTFPGAAISAAAGPRTAASTGARRRNACTTWSARSAPPYRRRVHRSEGMRLRVLRTRRGAKKSGAPAAAFLRAEGAVAARCAPTARFWSSSGWNWTDGRSPRKN